MKEVSDEIMNTIDKYKKEVRNQQIEREKAWEICYQYFYCARKLRSCDYDYLSLHLSSYLACWGMFRNSILLKTNYRIHIGAVDLLMRPEYDELCGIKVSNYSPNKEEKLEKLINELRKVYTTVKKDVYKVDSSSKCNISDTLISKVLLGTLACVPAYDENVIKGMSTEGIKPLTLSAKSIKCIIKNLGNFKFENTGISFADESIEIPYPQMKVVDMYYYQKGKEHPGNT